MTGLDQRLLAERDTIRAVLGRKWRQAVVLTAGRLGFDYGCLLAALRATGASPRPSLVLLAYSATATDDRPPGAPRRARPTNHQRAAKRAVAKRLDRPRVRVIPEWFGGGTLPRKELHELAEQLTASQAGLIAVGEPTIEKALDKALTKADKVVKRNVAATTDEITSELQEALKS